MRIDVVVPQGWDDPRRPSGGNHYDQRLIAQLHGAADVAIHVGTPAGVPDGARVVVDGLVGSADPAGLIALASRAHVIVLAHLPFGIADEAARAGERDAFAAAHRIVVPSRYVRSWLVETYGIAPDRVCVATPGVDPAPPAAGSERGNSLLCLANLYPGKGHDVLVTALSQLADLAWDFRFVGALDRDPGFVTAVQAAIRAHALSDRVCLVGPRTGADLDGIWQTTDLFVLPTRAETYGMAITEAFARGVPVVASDVGGVREAVGGDGGLLVPTGDPDALATALRTWLTTPSRREELRRGAARRRNSLDGWGRTADTVLDALR